MDTPTTLLAAVRYFRPDRCEDYMRSLRWPGGRITCPECNSTNVGKLIKDASQHATLKNMATGEETRDVPIADVPRVVSHATHATRMTSARTQDNAVL